MKAIGSFTLVVSLVVQVALSQDRQSIKPITENVGVGSVVAYQTALARADLAVAKSLLNERLLKGEVGEAIRDQTVGRFLHRSGQWLNVSPRLGPQGLDHVSVQLNENGKPYRLMVDETKFGSGRLLTTKLGDIQMGGKYVSQRLSGLAKRFDAIRAQGDVTSAKTPSGLSSKRVIQVPLSDSESVHFWRSAEGAGPWRYDGDSESLPKAVAQLKRLSELFRAGADGRIDFRKRVFQVKPTEGMGFEVTIRDAADVERVGGRITDLPVSAKIPGSLNEPEWREAFRKGIARELQRANPAWTGSQSDFQAQRIIAEAKSTQDLFSKVSFEKALSDIRFSRFTMFDATKSGATAFLIAVPLELAFQVFGEKPVDWSHVAGVGGLAGGSAAMGSLAGSVATYALVRTELGYSASVAAADVLGLRSASHLANVAGGAVGGGATAIFFAYGGYWLGYYDIRTANRSAIAGVAGVGAGAAASATTLALIGTYATASTGTAISTLGGGAAFNASMAWLGGGSLATEGFGMAGGWVVLTGGGAIVVLGVTAAVLYGFHLEDEHQESVRLAKTIEYLSAKQAFFIPYAPSSMSR
jgi:hypothetical protein